MLTKILKPTAIFVFFSMFLLSSCKLSTNDLTEKVKTSMEEKFAGKGITIKSLILTKNTGNEYAGVLETKEPNGDFTYSVQVVYDGQNMTWKILSN